MVFVFLISSGEKFLHAFMSSIVCGRLWTSAVRFMALDTVLCNEMALAKRKKPHAILVLYGFWRTIVYLLNLPDSGPS